MTDLLSRAGKSSSQRFKILQDQMSILQNRARKLVAPSLLHLPPLKKAEANKEEMEALIAQELQALHKDRAAHRTTKHGSTRPSAIFQAQDREDFYRAIVSTTQDRKDRVPPCGHYNVTYAQVDGQASARAWRPDDRELPEAVQSSSPEPIRPSEPEDLPQRSPMSLQLPRKPPQAPFVPHDRRFEHLQLPTSLAKYKKTASMVDMARGIERPDFLHVRVGPEYTSNPEVLMTDLGRTLSFRTMNSRKPLFFATDRPVYQLNPKAMQSKTLAADFSKSVPRDRHPRGGLPAYMQGSFNRVAVSSLSEKSIRLRCDRNSELSPGFSVMDYIKQLNYELRKGK